MCISSPDQCGSFGWALSLKEKGRQFDSCLSMPGLQVRSRLGAHERQPVDVSLSHWIFLSFIFSLPYPLSKNK